jgi:hypothetical protein
MPTPTYTLLDSVTLGSSAASVTFSSIDQSYGDLVISIDGSNSGTENLLMTLNTDTTDSNYSNVYMRGFNGAASSGTVANRQIATIWSDRMSTSIQLMDYSATDKHKSALSKTGLAVSAYPQLYARAWRWANTAAVTSIQLSPSAGTFNSTSTFFLYGIAKAL